MRSGISTATWVVRGTTALTLTRAAVVSADLQRCGISALLVSPATDTGLTPGDLDRIQDFLNDDVSPAMVPVPPDLDHPDRHHAALAGR